MPWLMVPDLIGPLLGPPLGGFIVTFLSWQWIFYIILPIGLLGIVLALRFIENVRLTETVALDIRGFVLSSVALSCLIFGFEMMARQHVPAWRAAAVVGPGLLCGWLYIRHARRHPAPILDIRLMSVRTFQVSVVAGGLSRTAVGALPFLLPMMLQLGFGWSAAASGSVALATSAGPITIRLLGRPILRRFGFRRIMIWNGAVAAVLIGCVAFIRPSWPASLIVVLLFIVELFEAVQFIAHNTIAYAGIPPARISAATGFYATFQQLNLTVGICVAGWAFAASMALFQRSKAVVEDYAIALLSVAALSMLAAPAGSAGGRRRHQLSGYDPAGGTRNA